MNNQTIHDVQMKILEVMKFIDKVCRKNDITYFIMGGTALGAVRHGGFIPWDDDLDIFMTPDQYEKFKLVFNKLNDTLFVIQEWKTTEHYLEYAKVRMNGTTLIEHNFANCKNMHHGIYVDIMILHKVPTSRVIQKIVYYQSKFVTLLGLSQRNWKSKNLVQELALKILKVLPKKLIANWCYKNIYAYDNLKSDFNWCYWITPASFEKGVFPQDFFSDPIDIPFEDIQLLGSRQIEKYLSYRYGDYMKLPPKEQQLAAVHAEIFDTENDFSKYIR